MDTISILAALDQNYLPQLHVLLTSVQRNNPGEHIDLYLMHSGLSERDLDIAAARCRGYGYGLYPVEIDSAIFADAPTKKQYPQEMYYRLLAGQFLPNHLERVIYLDPDILVINPLRPLWEMDLKGNLFAAAAHTGKTDLANSVNRLRLGTDHDYYNSGVLLIDLAACRRIISPAVLFQYVAEHGRELLLPDQDILNGLYGSSVLPLDDAVWNYDARNYNTYFLASSGRYDVSWVMANTAILHFCGKAKPWKPGYLYRFGLLYQHYMQIARRPLSGGEQ